MTRTYATITDLAAYLADVMDLDRAEVAAAIRQHHHLFSAYERITAAELAALAAAVWTHITGLAYPEEWALQDARDEQEVTP